MRKKQKLVHWDIVFIVLAYAVVCKVFFVEPKQSHTEQENASHSATQEPESTMLYKGFELIKGDE